MGQSTEGMHLVETVGDVKKLQIQNVSALSYVTQTTLSLDDAREVIAALKSRFPDIVGPKGSDICYATQNRQDATKAIAASSQVVAGLSAASRKFKFKSAS